MAHPRFRLFLLCAVFAACGGGMGGGGGCGGAGGCALQPIPNGGFNGEKVDSAASGRLTADGFSVVNVNAPLLLDQFAPGGQLVVPLSCSIQSALLENLTIADEGQISCNAETCGQLDGKCDSKDEPKQIVINVSTLSLAPKAPDLLEANIDITLATGKIMISSVARNSVLCLFSGPVKCSVDFDTARATPANNKLSVHIKFSVDPRWDRVLSLEISDIGGSKTCGTAGALPKPECFDPSDIIIASEGPCGACSAANFSIIKTLILDQITKSLTTRLEDTLKKSNCRACGADLSCPKNAVADSTCEVKDGGSPDAGGGQCFDTGTGKCVPGLLGVEGRMALGQLAAGLVPQDSAMDLSIAAGGGATANAQGLTLGFRGGAKEVTVPACVKPLTHAMEPALPLPDLDADAPGAYDVGLTVSSQLLSRAFFHAQQSGALCLELGHDQIVQLESGLLGTLLPSLNKLAGKDVDGNQISLPLRVVIRPVNPPTATLGEGTFDPVTNKPIEPLIRFDWPGVEIDLYAQLDERYVRLFTLAADVKLPIGLTLSGCSDVTPMLGEVGMAIDNVHARSSEILPENLAILEQLVPMLLSFAEPSLAKGFQAFTVPTFGGWQLKLLAAKGVGLVSGTRSYNHMGIYAKLLPSTQVCVAMAPRLKAVLASHEAEAVTLKVEASRAALPEYQTRVNGGFWSTWRRAGFDGSLRVVHPRLVLKAEHRIDVRVRDAAKPEATSELLEVVVPN
jgi:hypothetical protein